MVHPAHLKEVSQYEKDLNTLLEKLSSIRCKPVICDLYLCDESKLFERHDRNAYYGLRNPMNASAPPTKSFMRQSENTERSVTIFLRRCKSMED